MESSWDGHPSVRFFPIFAQHFWNAVLVIDGFSITSLTKAQTHLGKRVCLCVFVCVGCSIDHTCEVHISSYLIPHMHNFASVLKIFAYFKRDVSMLLLWSTLLLHSFTSQLTHSTLHPVVFQKALTCNAYVTLLDIQIWKELIYFEGTRYCYAVSCNGIEMKDRYTRKQREDYETIHLYCQLSPVCVEVWPRFKKMCVIKVNQCNWWVTHTGFSSGSENKKSKRLSSNSFVVSFLGTTIDLNIPVGLHGST